MNWLRRVLFLPWSVMPSAVAVRIWRAFSSEQNPPPPISVHVVLPATGKDSPWTAEDAGACRAFLQSLAVGARPEPVERVLRLVEIRKRRFFADDFCHAALVLSQGFAEHGLRQGDLRYTNAALKLRDWAASTRPPFFADERHAFAMAENSIYQAVRLLDQ